MAGMERQLDLIAIGRSGIDLYGEQVGGRLEDMASFAKYIGGSPTNTAVGASRLGLRSGLLTRVGADHFGRFIREQLQSGRFNNASEVVRAGLRLLEDDEQRKQLALEALRSEIVAGRNSGKGKLAAEVFDRLEAKYTAMACA